MPLSTHQGRNDTKNHATPAVLALRALAWIAQDEARLTRMLGLTGLDPGDLRARADDPALLAAVLGFLGAHEPDLVACAEAIGCSPAALEAARETLER